MRLVKLSISVLLLALPLLTALANDGTVEGTVTGNVGDYQKPGTTTRVTDDVYIVTPYESVTTGSSVWRDNRHRAYINPPSTIANGFLLFDVSGIPDGSNITSMTLTCYLENAYGSPMGSPLVDVYYSEDDGWDRNTVGAGDLDLDVVIVNDILFSSWQYSYDFIINVAAHDWSQDLIDNEICIGFTNVNLFYSYVYFFGAYGTPTGPPPELTIETGTAPVYDVVVDITYQSGSPVPAGGGDLNFNAFLENQDTVPATFDVWLASAYAGGNPTTLILRSFSNYLPGWTIDRDLYYPVPGTWAGGNYVMPLNVGDEPGTMWDTDSFNWIKSGADVAGFVPYPVDGAPDPFDEIIKPEAELPGEFAVTGSYPNPFNPSTTIAFDLPEAAQINLAVYDISGRQVAQLIDGWQDAGSHEAIFNAADLASGVYIYRLNAGDFNANGKMLLMK